MIHKCPHCGGEPTELDYYGNGLPCSYLCCGVEIYTSEAWNRYATAMELARATAMPVRGARQIAEWSEAEEAVLKAWREE